MRRSRKPLCVLLAYREFESLPLRSLMLARAGHDHDEPLAVQRRTTLVSILTAALLVVLKLGAGLLSGSLGLISAGIESSGDVIAATLTFFAVRLGGRPPDRGPPP